MFDSKVVLLVLMAFATSSLPQVLKMAEGAQVAIEFEHVAPKERSIDGGDFEEIGGSYIEATRPDLCRTCFSFREREPGTVVNVIYHAVPIEKKAPLIKKPMPRPPPPRRPTPNHRPVGPRRPPPRRPRRPPPRRPRRPPPRRPGQPRRPICRGQKAGPRKIGK